MGILVFDPDQNIRFANAAHRSLLGRDAREAGIETWLRQGCRTAGLADRVVSQWREYVWQKQLRRVFPLGDTSGQLHQVEIEPRLLSDGDLLVTLRDVTDHRHLEAALKLRETEFLAVLRRVGTAVALIDREGRFLETNPAFERLLGYSRTELRRLGLADCLTRSDLERLREAALALPGDPAEADSAPAGEAALDLSWLPREGQPVSARVRIAPTAGSQGRILFTALFLDGEGAAAEYPDATGPDSGGNRAVVVVGDIGEEAPTREALERRSLAFQEFDGAILLTDLKGRILDGNAAAERAFGSPLPDLRGSGLARLYAAPGSETEFNAALSEALTAEGRWQGECPYRRGADGEGRAELSVFPVFESGQPRLLVAIHREAPAARVDPGSGSPADPPSPAGAADAAGAVDGAGATGGDGLWNLGLDLTRRSLDLAEPKAGDAALLKLRLEARLAAVALLARWREAGPSRTVSLAELTRQLVTELLQRSADFRNRLPLRFRIRADESIAADRETALAYALLLGELVLPAIAVPPTDLVPELALSLFEGHPRLDFTAPPPAAADLSEPVLRLLASELRASLRLEQRDGRAAWLVRFPATR